jgi:hypothetical protein
MLAPDAISAGPSEATAGFEVALHPSVNVGNPLANGSLGASTRAGMRREIAGQRGGAGWTRTSDRRIISSHGVHSYASCGISAGPGRGPTPRELRAALCRVNLRRKNRAPAREPGA